MAASSLDNVNEVHEKMMPHKIHAATQMLKAGTRLHQTENLMTVLFHDLKYVPNPISCTVKWLTMKVFKSERRSTICRIVMFVFSFIKLWWSAFYAAKAQVNLNT